MTEVEYNSLRIFVEGKSFPRDYNAAEILRIMTSLKDKYPDVKLPTIEKD